MQVQFELTPIALKDLVLTVSCHNHYFYGALFMKKKKELVYMYTLLINFTYL